MSQVQRVPAAAQLALVFAQYAGFFCVQSAARWMTSVRLIGPPI